MRQSQKIESTAIAVVLFLAVVGICTGAVAAADGANTTGSQAAEKNSSALTDTSETQTENATTQAINDVEVSVTTIPSGGSFSPDGTMDIFVGAYNDTDTPVGVAGEALTVSIERPDGVTETFDVTTDANGSTHIAYDLSETNRETGTYTVTVTNNDGDQMASVQPTVGPVIEAMNNRNAPLYPDEETTYSFLVRSGESGVEDEPVEITVTDPNGNVVNQEQVTTNADGFVETTLTPSQTGDYVIQANLSQQDDSVTKYAESVEMTVVDDYDLTQGISGEQAVYGGYVRGANGNVANTDLVVRFVNTTRYGEYQYVANKTTTTDENGFFLVDYQVPDDATRMEAQVETASGTVLTTEYLSIDSLEPASSADVSLSAEFEDYNVAPGDDATVNIEATENGQPLANEEVNVLVQLDYDGAPIRSTTVTTDQDGTANATVSIPEGAESADLDGVATMTYNGETQRSSLFGSVEKYNIYFDTERGQVGQELNFSVRAETLAGTPVEGVPLQFAGLYTDYKAGTYATGQLVTGTDGTDSTSVSVPADLSPGSGINYVSRYASTGVNRIYMFEYPGTLQIGASDETEFGRPVAAPGEEITLDFSTPNGTTANGIAYATVRHSNTSTYAETSIGTTIATDSESTLTIPEYAADDSYVSMTVWSTDAEDNFYVDRQGFEINSSSSTTQPPLDVSLSPSSVTANEMSDVTVTVTDGNNGTAVSGATVGISELGMSATTNASGIAVLSVNTSSVGEFTVSASADGYEDAAATLTVESDGTTVGIEPATQTTNVGSAVEYNIAVDGYDAGIASYEFDASLGNGSTASITNVSLQGTSPDNSLTSVDYAADNSSVSVAAGTAGHDSGVIATLTVEGVASGTTSLELSGLSIGDENANSYSIAKTTNGTLTVVGAPTVAGGSPAQDPDNDGTYEDVNGDGTFNIVDVSAMFQNYNSDAVQNNTALFDFNDDGQVNIVDVSRLFQSSQS